MNNEVERFPGELRLLRKVLVSLTMMVNNTNPSLDDECHQNLSDCHQELLDANQEFIQSTEAFKSGRTSL